MGNNQTGTTVELTPTTNYLPTVSFPGRLIPPASVNMASFWGAWMWNLHSGLLVALRADASLHASVSGAAGLQVDSSTHVVAGFSTCTREAAAGPCAWLRVMLPRVLVRV